MEKISKLIVVIVSTIFLVACGDVNFHGQAFIKVGDVATKLSDLEIHVINESELLLVEEEFKKNAEATYSQILKNIRHLKNKNDELQVLRTTLANLLEVEKYFNPIDPQTLPAAQVKLEAVDGSIKSAREELSKELETLKKGNHPAIYFMEKVGQDIRTTRTDADGKFSIKISHPNGKLIVARRDKKYWFLRLSEKESEINLSDSNAFESACPTCAFTGESSQEVRNRIAVYIVEKVLVKNNSEIEAEKKNTSRTITEDSVTRSAALVKNGTALAKKISDLMVSEVIAGGSSGPAAADIQYILQMTSINIQKGILVLRENHKNYSIELLAAASAFDPVQH